MCFTELHISRACCKTRLCQRKYSRTLRMGIYGMLTARGSAGTAHPAVSAGVWVRRGGSAGVSSSALAGRSHFNASQPQSHRFVGGSRRARPAVVRCESRSSQGEHEAVGSSTPRNANTNGQHAKAQPSCPPLPASLKEQALREVEVQPPCTPMNASAVGAHSQLSSKDSAQSAAVSANNLEPDQKQEAVKLPEPQQQGQDGESLPPWAERFFQKEVNNNKASSAVHAAGLLKKLEEERYRAGATTPAPSSTPYSAPLAPATANAISDGAHLQVENDSLDLKSLLRTVAALEAQEAAAREQTREVLSLLHAAARALVIEKKAQDNRLAVAPRVKDQEQTEVAPELPSDAVCDDAPKWSQDWGSQKAQPPHQVMQHPGAVCSTQWHIDRKTDSNSATVTLQTTCNSAGDPGSIELEMEDYVALASRALVDRALDLSRDTANDVRGVDEENADIHGEAIDILQNGQVISARPNDVVSKFGHPSYFVRLQHPVTLKEIDAIFKPAVEGDGDGWHRASIEWVAYELNRMLGMDYVPPVAYRTGGVDVDYHHYEEGAFILFVNQVKELRDAPSGTRGVPLNRLLSDTRILDVLLYNSDRHHGHFLHGEHWAVSNPDGKPMMRPVLIDHAAGFRPEAFVSMEHENAFITGPVKTVPARTFLRLRFLDAKRIALKFGGVLTEHEMRGLLHRRNVILDYLDNLVEQNGYEASITE